MHMLMLFLHIGVDAKLDTQVLTSIRSYYYTYVTASIATET